MKKLRQKFERLCYRNRNRGIANLMLYITIGSAIVYLFTEFYGNFTLYYALRFDRDLILQGQVWRLFSFVFVYNAGSLLATAISLFCYYSLGRAMENLWGTFRFNLYYFTGILLMVLYAFLFDLEANIFYLNMSLFLGYATLYPNTSFLLFFIIPVKAWIFGVLYLALFLTELLVYPFPYNLFPVVALANYFLFFGKDVLNLIPVSWQANARRLFRGKKGKKKGEPRVIPFPSAGSYEASTASVKAPYTHKCTVCGRTDVSNPELEFRYCSRCNGYHCYCEEHINNHTHIE